MKKAYTEQSERQQEAHLAQLEKRREQDTSEAIKQVMQTPQGRRVMHWVMYQMGRLNELSFAYDKRDATEQHTAFREGHRGLAISIGERLREVAPDQFSVMVTEREAEVLKDLALTGTGDKDE